ncbi:TetR/AcrR family transcriptional regulator C-terminal domain-containing protein [Aurantimonas sp. C2-3-R2]|uniref:TetR/AcrR family transcriptional regulator C-terminal domain-containing protein n=1 Tax=unclassified Aurantimonas TaxID=2638230 RepID=UPI003FA4AA6C
MSWRRGGRKGHLPLMTRLPRSLHGCRNKGCTPSQTLPALASQFVALVSAEAHAKSLGGALPVEPNVLNEAVADGVATFLCAYPPMS